MIRGIVVGALVGLCAVSVYLMSQRSSMRAAEQNPDLRRWEDDGGHLPEVDQNDARSRAVVADTHST